MICIVSITFLTFMIYSDNIVSCCLCTWRTFFSVTSFFIFKSTWRFPGHTIRALVLLLYIKSYLRMTWNTSALFSCLTREQTLGLQMDWMEKLRLEWWWCTDEWTHHACTDILKLKTTFIYLFTVTWMSLWAT